MEQKTLGIIQLIIGIIFIGVYLLGSIPSNFIPIGDVDILYVLTGLFAILTAIPNLKK